ncbi:unnamed protein product, partial [Symbiodinium microadriaticum]
AGTDVLQLFIPREAERKEPEELVKEEAFWTKAQEAPSGQNGCFVSVSGVFKQQIGSEVLHLPSDLSGALGLHNGSEA